MTRPFPNPTDDGLLLGGIFSGMGGWEVAAGTDWTQVFAAECDKHARKVFEANLGRAPDVGNILLVPSSCAPFAHVYTVTGDGQKFANEYCWRFRLPCFPRLQCCSLAPGFNHRYTAISRLATGRLFPEKRLHQPAPVVVHFNNIGKWGGCSPENIPRICVANFCPSSGASRVRVARKLVCVVGGKTPGERSFWTKLWICSPMRSQSLPSSRT